MRNFFFLFLCFISFLIFIPSVIAQATPKERDQIIQNKLSCMANHSDENELLNWDEICVVKSKGTGAREAIIAAALDEASNEPSNGKMSGMYGYDVEEESISGRSEKVMVDDSVPSRQEEDIEDNQQEFEETQKRDRIGFINNDFFELSLETTL